MAQVQRKQAGWKHEIDRIAGGDFELFMKRYKRMQVALTRWRMIAVVVLVWAVVASVMVVVGAW